MTTRFAPVAAEPQSPPQPIGGWLALLGIGLLLNPLLLLYGFYHDVWPLYTGGIISRLALPSGDMFDPHWAALIWWEIIGIIVRFNLGLLVLWKFYTHSRQAPPLFIALILLNCVYQIGEVMLVKPIPEMASNPAADNTAEAIKSVFYAFIWIPYLVLSERVKATFTK